MVRRMSVKDARSNFSELLGIVFYTKEPVIIERKGKPFAVMINPELYENLLRDAARTAIDRIRERNADKDPDDVLRDINEVVEEVRQEMYEQEQRSKGRP